MPGPLRVCVGRSVLDTAVPAERVLRIIGYLDRCTPVHELHMFFRLCYVYDYTAQLHRTQAEVILNHVNPNVHG
jgi:hypothetical protein